MKIFFGLLVLFGLVNFGVGCGVMKATPATSGALSSKTPGELQLDPGSAVLFEKVKPIIQARCASCHAEYPQYTEIDWIQDGYVSANVAGGDPASSSFFTRLKGSGVPGLADMPQGAPLSAGDVETIRLWIVSVKIISRPTEPDESGSSASLRTSRATKVITKNCGSCHSVEFSTVSGVKIPAFGIFESDSAFVSTGLIQPISLEDSWLYQSLRGYGSSGAGSIATMPPGENMSAEDELILRTWINGMGSP